MVQEMLIVARHHLKTKRIVFLSQHSRSGLIDEVPSSDVENDLMSS